MFSSDEEGVCPDSGRCCSDQLAISTDIRIMEWWKPERLDVLFVLLKTLANSITKVIRFANLCLPSCVKRWLIEAAISCQNIWLYVIDLASVFSKTSTYPMVLHAIPDCQWLLAWATLCLQCLLKDSVVSDEVEGQTARQEEDKTTLEENAARRFREWDELQWNICTWQQVNCVNCHVFARAS